MPVDLSVSQHVIQSFLAGARLKEQREQRIAEAEARAEALEVRRQQIADLAAQFKERHALETQKANSRMALDKARADELGIRLKSFGLNLLTKGKDLVTEGGGPLTLEHINQALSENGAAPVIRTQSPTELDQREINKQVGIAQGREDVTMPGKREMAILQGNIQANNQGAVQAAMDARAKLDRESREKMNADRVAASFARASATHADKLATKEQKDADDKDAIETALPQIRSGQMTLEDLATLPAQTRLKVVNAALANNGRIFKAKDKDKFNEIPEVFGFLNNAKALKDAYNNYNLNDARGLEGLMQPALGLFGRNILAEKGNLSNQDVARIGKLLPSFWLTKEQNEARVAEIESIIHNRFKQILGGMNPDQRQAVTERWGIPSSIGQSKSNNQNQQTGPKVGDTFKNPAGENVKRIE